MSKNGYTLVVFSLVSWVLAGPSAFAAATVLYDSTADGIAGFDLIAKDGPLAFSFTTGGTASNLTDLKVSLWGTGGGSGSVTISLNSNNPNGPKPASPLANIGTVNDSAVRAGNLLVDLPVKGTIQLNANTRYWIVVSTNDNSVQGLNWSESDGGTGVSTEYNIFGGMPFTNSNGPYIGYVAANPPAPPPPTASVSGLVSASEFGGFSTVAPGSWIEIYGSNLAPDTRSWTGADFSGNNAPTSLDGVSVTVGGRNAFVDYISPGQINVQVPSNVSVGGMTTLTVTTGTNSSQPVNVNVQSIEPGLLAPPSFKVGNHQYVAAQFSDGSWAMPPGVLAGVTSRPAKPTDEVVLYGVGFGPLTSDTPAGVIATEGTQLTSPLQIMFGQTPAASIPYAGLSPGFVGLYQINVIVPNVPDNNLVPLTFNLGGIAGMQALFIAVHQ